jgi:hypothetical protein
LFYSLLFFLLIVCLAFFLSFFSYNYHGSQYFIIFQVGGIIVAPTNIQAWNDKEKWISFANIDGLTINGGGQIDGQGSVWWNACTDKVQIACHLYILISYISYNL